MFRIILFYLRLRINTNKTWVNRSFLLVAVGAWRFLWRSLICEFPEGPVWLNRIYSTWTVWESVSCRPSFWKKNQDSESNMIEMSCYERTRLHTSPFLSTPTRFILVVNFMTGGSSGYLSPVSIFKLYIRFSKFVFWMGKRFFWKRFEYDYSLPIVTLGGPMIMPFHFFIAISLSFSSPHETVPSPVPFWPSSSSSKSLKLLGIT